MKWRENSRNSSTLLKGKCSSRCFGREKSKPKDRDRIVKLENNNVKHDNRSTWLTIRNIEIRFRNFSDKKNNNNLEKKITRSLISRKNTN